ncbi:phosphoglycolate phosphatase [Plakobranchus ocellatus]|uniref:Phosphoglycolate phosphatase n=1 Tax=Plakobranchus ocellatus TaxID=259542 RepID=A0AAV4BK92_9GAST|nr:phosphoglycolate phosphatase [Plakobranchus ocellatus]
MLAGILWNSEGPIDGSLETIEEIMATCNIDHKTFLSTNCVLSVIGQGKRVFYITNKCDKTRKELLAELTEHGYPAKYEHIITNAYIIGQYLKDEEFTDKVYVFGNTKAIVHELAQFGIRCVGAENVPLGTPSATRLDPEVKQFRKYIRQGVWDLDAEVSPVLMSAFLEWESIALQDYN